MKLYLNKVSPYARLLERRYADGKSLLAQRWLAAVQRTIAALENDPALMHAHEHPCIGDFAIAVGLGYVAFRLPEVQWRANARHLVKWFDRVSERPSMRLTLPE